MTSNTTTTSFDPLTLALPVHWVPAIVNDDPSGLDDTECSALARWLADMHHEFGAFHIGDVSEGTFFARWHDAADYGVAACACADVTLMLPCVS